MGIRYHVTGRSEPPRDLQAIDVDRKGPNYAFVRCPQLQNNIAERFTYYGCSVRKLARDLEIEEHEIERILRKRMAVLPPAGRMVA